MNTRADVEVGSPAPNPECKTGTLAQKQEVLNDGDGDDDDGDGGDDGDDDAGDDDDGDNIEGLV